MNRKPFCLIAVLSIVMMLMAACGGASTPAPSATPTSSGGAQPTATPLAPSASPSAGQPPSKTPIGSGELGANSFRFEVVGAGEDKVIDGGLVQYAPASKSHSVALTEVGDFARYGVTLFTPLAVKVGEQKMVPHSSTYVEGYSAAIFIGAWFYHASAGTLTIEDVSNNTISGRFAFTAPREGDPSKVVKVTGEFKQIPIPATQGSAPSAGEETPGAAAAPTATLGATPAGEVQPTAGEFSFGAANAEMDIFVGSGTVHSELTFSGNEYSIGVKDEEQHSLSLFLPFGLVPGTIDLKPYDASTNEIGPSAILITGFDIYGATKGTITIDSVDDNIIAGSFNFSAASSSDTSKTIDVTGEFSQIQLPAVKVSVLVPTATPVPTKAASTVPAGALRQWANAATASSQYGEADWSAAQATGAPNTSQCGDSKTAWASAHANTVDWIEVSFSKPVKPVLINIVQSYAPSQVIKVELRDTDGKYHEVYTGKPDLLQQCPYILSIDTTNADYRVERVKITVDQTVLMTWNEIDAVELIGQP